MWWFHYGNIIIDWSGPILEFKGSIKHVQKGYPTFCGLSNAHWQSTFANMIADPISIIPFSHLQKMLRYFFVPFWNWKKEIRFVKVIDIFCWHKKSWIRKAALVTQVDSFFKIEEKNFLYIHPYGMLHFFTISLLSSWRFWESLVMIEGEI